MKTITERIWLGPIRNSNYPENYAEPGPNGLLRHKLVIEGVNPTTFRGGI